MFVYQAGAWPYSASVTRSPHSVSGPSCPSARPSQMARWVMKRSGVAPCQCHSPGGHHTVSPGCRTTTSPPRDWVRPMPSVTCRVCPLACRCQAVRAPGVKRTALTLPLDSVPGAMTSKCTTPVNHSDGPATEGGLLRIFTVVSLMTLRRATRRQVDGGYGRARALCGGLRSGGGEDLLGDRDRGERLGPA